MNTPIFYRAEVKGIQAWILASDRLRELKGGSAIIDGLAADARRLLHRLEVSDCQIITAAGGVEVVFENHASLERFAEAWPLVVSERAPGLTLVQAWGPADAPKQVYAALGAQRNRRAPSLPEAGPLMARSGRTGLPAVRSGSGKDDGLMDRIVAAKLDALKDGRAGLDRLAPDGFSFVEDADKLGEGYIAVVHADGNGVGNIVQRLSEEHPSEDRFAVKARFSSALSTATERAAKEAIEKLVGWTRRDDNFADGRGGHELRARPIVLGGDDLTFLVDARYGIPFTLAFLEAFQNATRAEKDILSGQGLDACAGLAFTKTGFPFHAGHALAESLCNAAKKGLRQGEHTPSGLLFHRVTTASADTSWEGLERGELCAGRDGLLSGGPYGLDRLVALSQLALALGSLPRGAVREWLTLEHEGSPRAAALWQRTRETAVGDVWERFAAKLTALDHSPQTGREPLPADPREDKPAPCTEQRKKPTWRTALGDALLWRTLQPSDSDRTRRTR
ncbi:MAG: hypothetical protein ABIO70_14460 [Pseudomonadota bacterium]